MMKCLLTSFTAIFCCMTMIMAQETPTTEIQVQADQPGIKVSPSLYGIFFEEINLAGDGGIYPELIRNRSFEFSGKTEFWSLGSHDNLKGKITLEDHEQGSEYNRKVLRVDSEAGGNGRLVVSNEGYWGIPIERGAVYQLTAHIKGSKEINKLDFVLESFDGKTVYNSVSLNPVSAEWETYSFQISSEVTDAKARLSIGTYQSGTFWLDMVSMKPAKTYKGHGLRSDLMEKLADMRPSFVRFPGGCWVEGDTMNEASRWKRTIGKPIDRWTQPNIWGYDSTNGLGYHEYLQMCEDLNADALFVINCGMAHKDHIPMDKMDEFVQDAMDAIEYARGPVTSKWGKIRAENGHSEPFALEYIQIGNENGGPIYWERYDLFYSKIREVYPDMKIVSNEWGGRKTNKKPIEIIDEHYYSTPTFFAKNADRYDSYDRNGPKIYVGEYAVTNGCGLGNLDAAIGEAAFMTGMERNSDVVIMSSYAPLFANTNHRRWNPDMICFDGTRVYGTPSYYVQQLFAQNRSDVVVPTTVTSSRQIDQSGGKVGLGSWETKVEYKDAKIEKNGQVLFESNLAQPPQNGKQQKGNWKFVDDVLRQDSDATDCRYLFGDEKWNDYTFSVKAKKISGNEGFLLLFNVKGADTWTWLNLGGWKNTGTAFQADADGSERGKFVDLKIETDRWYDIRIEVQGQTAKCFVDGQLIVEDKLPSKTLEPIYTVSGLNKKQDELIIKIVNFSSDPYNAKIVFNGAANLDQEAKLIELTSDGPSDENSLDSPTNVSPTETSVRLDGAALKRTLPAKSVTIVRVKIK